VHWRSISRPVGASDVCRVSSGRPVHRASAERPIAEVSMDAGWGLLRGPSWLAAAVGRVGRTVADVSRGEEGRGSDMRRPPRDCARRTRGGPGARALVLCSGLVPLVTGKWRCASGSPQPFVLSPRSGERIKERGGHPALAALVALILLAAAGGCSVSKWTVKPHQRELLSDRIMQLDADEQERTAEEHVLSNREGAVGGSGTSGGGCGCN
jgi:hypothetical protein